MPLGLGWLQAVGPGIIVLGLSLGQSGVYAAISLAAKLTAGRPLATRLAARFSRPLMNRRAMLTSGARVGSPSLTPRPRTWLATVGWRRAGGPIDCQEAPAHRAHDADLG